MVEKVFLLHQSHQSDQTKSDIVMRGIAGELVLQFWFFCARGDRVAAVEIVMVRSILSRFYFFGTQGLVGFFVV